VLPVGKYVDRLTAGSPCGSGELFLGINDDNVNDNSGAWKVRITVFTRADAQAPPVTAGRPPGGVGR